MTTTEFRDQFRKRRSVFVMGLDKLSSKERKVIKYRYGFGADIPMTLEEVGKKIGVSRQRIKQIEDCAFYKLTKK